MYGAQMLTATILFLCIRQTGAFNFLGLSQLRSAAQTHHLVTCGWYARMRHPLYFFSTLFLAMNPVMTAQWALLTMFSVTYFIIGAIIEERRLLKEFGEEYQEYRKRVPIIIPALRATRRQHP
jgi:protein-S-isoprenylcysteine O-methyltransferase Ste14